MSNDVSTSDGGAPMTPPTMTPPTSRRRALWVATGVAGLTGVVGLAALGGLAARDDKSDDAQRVSENRAAAPQNVSDDGKAAVSADAAEQNLMDQKGRDGKGGDEDQEEAGAVQEVPCDEDALVDALDLANRDHGGTLKLAKDCTYELHDARKKTDTGLPTIKQEITIKGEGSTIKRNSEDGFRIFRVAEGGDLTLKDLTVKNGNVGDRKHKDWPTPPAATALQAAPPPKHPHDKHDGEDGGGLLVERGGSATLKDTTFTRNSADGNGGAIANFGQVEAVDTTIDNNHAGDNGGGIFNAGHLEVEGSGGKGDASRITNNTAGKNGGGIANGTGKDKDKHDGNKHDGKDKDKHDGKKDDAGTVKVDKTLIEGNKADKNGGGIFSSGGFVDVSWTFIKNNTACENGGGIYATDTVLKVHKVAVKENHASKDGGGIYTVSSDDRKHNDAVMRDGKDKHKDKDKDKGGTATVTDSEILDNSAGRFGGGIFNGEPAEDKHKGNTTSNAVPNHNDHKDLEATLTLRDTKVAENFAGKNGGGIYNNEGKVTLTNSHVTKNKAQVKDDNDDIAGGIFNNDGKVTLDDQSTVTKNDPRNCAGDDIEGCED